jgi:hypothetical protein
MKDSSSKIALALLVLSSANIAAQYMAGHPVRHALLTSDLLYLPTLFSDVISKGGTIKDWFLSPAPYFFPDYLFFVPSYFIGRGSYSQVIIFSLIQVALTFGATWFLARRTLQSGALVAASSILVFLIWLSLNSGDPFIFLLASANHYGAFLVSILLVALWLSPLDQRRKKWIKVSQCSAFAIMTFALSLSDNLFIVQFIAPLLAAATIVAVARKDFSLRTKIPLVAVIFFAALGSASYRFLVTHPTRYAIDIGVEKIWVNLDGVCIEFYKALFRQPIFLLMLAPYLYLVALSFYRLAKDSRYFGKLHWLCVFSFLSFCFTLAAVVLSPSLDITIRYFIPSFSWPVVVVFLFAAKYLAAPLFVGAATVISSLAAASLSLASFNLIRAEGLETRYYPSEISCIDDALERAAVDNGIAQYWDAKYIQNFSRLNLNIAQYFDNLDEMHWITSIRYFKRAYDFAIISRNAPPPFKISQEHLARLNGAPELVLDCGSRSVYIYGKNGLRVK